MPAASRVKRSKPDLLSDIEMRADSTRVLHRLNEPGACLAVAADMDQGVVVREDASGQTIRIAVADRQVIEAMALTDWIACTTPGRIARYHITAAGRAALRQQLAEAESAQQGMAEAATPFDAAAATTTYTAVESVLQLLARRRNRDGALFLAGDLLGAGERPRDHYATENRPASLIG